MAGPYKPVGVDADSLFPPRVETRLAGTMGEAISAARMTAARADGVYIPSPTAAIRWHQIRSATLSGKQQSHICWLGDSIGYGAAKTGASKPKPGNVTAGLLRASLARKFGSAGGGLTPFDGVRLRRTQTGGITFTDAGDLVTISNHGLAVGDIVVFGTITSTTGISAATNYYVNTVPSTSTFTISATNGGSTLALTNNGSAATAQLFAMTDDPRFFATQGVTQHNFGMHASSSAWRIQTLGGAEYIEFTDTCSEFWLYTLSGGSQFQVTVDGGANITLLNAADAGAVVSDIPPETGYFRNVAVNAHNVFKIPAGATGSHTLRIWPITSGSVFAVMVEGRIPTVGTFRVGNTSFNGKALSTFLAYTGEGGDANGGIYSGDLWLDTLKADLLVMALGVNDWQQDLTPATTKARMVQVIQRQRATDTNAYGSTKPGGDVVLVWNPLPDITALGAPRTRAGWDAYRDMFYEVAVEQDVCLIDLGEQWGTYAQANARGLYADSIHPADSGYLDYAARIETALFNVI